jgi:hypothetical protein
MSDSFELTLKPFLIHDADDILEQMPKETVVRWCVFYGAVEFVDKLIEISTDPGRYISMSEAKVLLTKMDALRAALEHGAEYGDDD